MGHIIGRGRYARAVYPPSKPLGGGVPVTPQTIFFWVCPQTAVPAPDQDGSPMKPFSTVQQAVDATVAAGSPSGRVYLAGPDVNSVVLPVGFSLCVDSFPGTSSSMGQITLDNFCAFSARDVALFGIDQVAPALTLLGVYLAYTDYTVAIGRQDVVGTLDLPNSPVGIVNGGCHKPITAQGLSMTGCVLGRSGGTQANIVVAGDFRANNCLFDNGGAPPNMTVNCGSGGRIVGCEFQSRVDFTNPFPLELDTYSNRRFINAGCSATGAVVVIV